MLSFCCSTLRQKYPRSIVQHDGFHFEVLASGEIGDVYGLAAVGDGPFAKRCDARPSGGIVNILVQRQAVFEAINNAPDHHEVHTAVAAVLFGEGFQLGPKRVVVFGF